MPSTAPDLERPPVRGYEHDDRSPLRRRLTIGLAAGVFAAMMFGWIYAFFIYDPGLMIDELADRTFPKQAEQVCARAEAQLEQLPRAESAKDAVERADTVDQANLILTTMVDDLRPLVPQGQGKITSGIGDWLDDWDTHIADRQAYADSLRTDPETRFSETTKANRQISRAIDAFAQVNRMESCATPGDVG